MSNFNLISEVNDYSKIVKEISENWSLTTEDMEEFGFGGPKAAAMGRAAEREFTGSFTDDSDELARKDGSGAPEEGDIVLMNRQMYMITGMTPDKKGYSARSLADGKEGYKFDAEYMEKFMMPKVGADGKKMWRPKPKGM